MFSSTLSLTSALDWGGSQRYVPAVLPSAERYVSHFTGGCVCPMAGLDECR